MDDELKPCGGPASIGRKSERKPDRGAGSGGRGAGEDRDDDRPTQSIRKAGPGHKGHPLPGSGEARHDEIPEHLEREKGRGDDPAMVIQPGAEAVDPDGRAYPYREADRQ